MTPNVSQNSGLDAASLYNARRGVNIRSLIDKIGPLIGLIFVVLLFSALKRDTFATLDNAQLILLQTAVVAIAALGMTMIIISGGIDLSVGSTIALCTVTIALLLQKGLSPVLAVLGGIATGMGTGLLIGLMVTRLKLSPFIVTLGMLSAVRGVALGLSDGQSVLAPDTWLNTLITPLVDARKWMIFPPGVWLALLLAILVACMLGYTRFGRHIFAIGSNEQTARLCGVNIDMTKLGIYVLAGALAGIAGLIQFSSLTLGDATTANGMELSIIAAVVIGGASLSGGQGSIFGTLIGALITATVANGCTKMGLHNWVQMVVTGGIIVAAVTLDHFRHRRPS